MRIISANLNQRLGNGMARARFESWLMVQAPDLLLAQEPFKPANQTRPDITGYRLISTTPLVSCWLAECHDCPKVIQHCERWHEVRFNGLDLHNVYLSPHSSKARRELLREMAYTVGGSDEECCVVLGDFNLAPRPEDGVFGDKLSTFTKAGERQAFASLISSGKLVDATCPEPGAPGEFTFERIHKGQSSRFRCDLALVSESLRGSAAIAYDHSVRQGAGAFTDHSAVLVDVSCTRPTPSLDLSQRNPSANSYKTAIQRNGKPSKIARQLHDSGVLTKLDVRSILDFGCGHGADVEFYREAGYQADGFDIEPSFGWNACRGGLYDLVTVVFVINTLGLTNERLASIESAAWRVRPGGHLLIAARSESAVKKKDGWVECNDGWITARGTFQKGIPKTEIEWLMGAVGLQIVKVELRPGRDVSWGFGRRPLRISNR